MLAKRLMWILWPAFLAACAMEMLVFALVDPSDIQWQGVVLDGGRQAFYTVSFFVFWLVSGTASALTYLLGRGGGETNDAGMVERHVPPVRFVGMSSAVAPHD